MSLRFEPDEGLIVVPTLVRGPAAQVTIRLALDTGATGTMIGWDLLMLIGCDPAGVVDRTQMTTGNGVEFVPRVPVDRIEALGLGKHAFPVLAHTLPPSATVDGVLGLDFLRGHRMVVDFRAGVVDVA